VSRRFKPVTVPFSLTYAGSDFSGEAYVDESDEVEIRECDPVPTDEDEVAVIERYVLDLARDHRDPTYDQPVDG
jgi:hypothetical protein